MINKKKNGFTLTEIIAALVILGVILLIAIPSVSNLRDRFKKEYYKKLNDSVIEATKMYFKNNENSKPDQVLGASFLTIQEMRDGKYLNKINVYNSENKCSGKAVIVNIGDNYKYVNCMNCGDYSSQTETERTEDNSDSNICLFTNSDLIERMPAFKYNQYYFYIGNYSNNDLKSILCVGEEIVRKNSDKGERLYGIDYTGEDARVICPNNITSVNVNKVGEYKLTYKDATTEEIDNGDGTSKQILKDIDRLAIVFKHKAPKLSEDNSTLKINKVGNTYYVQGKYRVILDDISTFENNSVFDKFQYKDDSTWNDISSLNYIGENTISDQYDKNVSFRAVGIDKNSYKKVDKQIGEESVSYHIVSKKVTITLNKDGGTGGVDNVKPWMGFKLSEKIQSLPTKSGYIFNGYCSAKNGGGTCYYNDQGDPISDELIIQDKTLYANWREEIKEEPTYTFKATNSTGTLDYPDNSDVKIGTYYYVVNITKDDANIKSVVIKYHNGNTKTCIATNKTYDCGSIQFSAYGTYKASVEILYRITSFQDGISSKSLTLNVPIWTLKYNISNCSSKTAANGEKWGELCQPTKKGYSFNLWKNDSGVTITQDTYALSDVNVQAQFAPNTYVISYDANGGKFSDNNTTKNISIVYDQYYILPSEPKMTGYTFIGWNTKKDGSGETKTELKKMETDSNHTLYAQWGKNESYLKVVDGTSTTYSGEYGQLKQINNPSTKTSETYNNYKIYLDYNGGSGTTSGPLTQTNKITTSQVFNRWVRSGDTNGTLSCVSGMNYCTYTFPPNKGVTATLTSSYSSSTSTQYGTVNLPTASRSGYTFLGWQENGGNPFKGQYSTTTGDITLKAAWEKDTYTVVLNDGNTEYTKLCNASEQYCFIAKPEKTGYTFSGSNPSGIDSTGNYKNTGYQNPDSVRGKTYTFDAKWTANIYKITLNGNGATTNGTPVIYEKYNTGWYSDSAATQQITSITKPTRTGYKFDAYYYRHDSIATTVINENGVIRATSNTFTSDTQLNANWLQGVYTITLDKQGGSGGTNQIYEKYTYGYYLDSSTSKKMGTAFDDANHIEVPTRTGYTFGGYYTGTNGSGSQYIIPIYGTLSSNAQSTNYTSNGTLYAQWNIKSYNVVFDVNGGNSWNNTSCTYTNGSSNGAVFGTECKKIIQHGVKFGILPIPTRTGYIFDGWYQINNHKISSDEYCETNQTLLAHWIPITYTVKYNGNGSTSGSTSSSTHTYDVSKALTTNGFSRTGYKFNGWNTRADGTGTSYSNSQSISNLTTTNGTIYELYAKWTPITYTVKYNGNGSTSGSTTSSTHTYDVSKALTTNGFSRTGYKFNGWNTRADGTGIDYSNSQLVSNLTSTDVSTVNLYAKWLENAKITVNFYQTDGTNSQQECTINGGNSCAITAPALKTILDPNGTQYATKIGWSTSPTGTTSNWTPQTSSTVTDSNAKDYYAVYSYTVTVSYNANGGSGTMSASSGTSYMTAKGSGSGYNVKTANITIKSNSFIAPTGYNFKEWRTSASGSGTLFSVGLYDGGLAKNKSLYAIWSKKQFTLHYENSGNCNGKDITVEYGDKWSSKTICTPTARVNGTALAGDFLGWYASSPSNGAVSYLDGRFNPDSVANADRTVYGWYSSGGLNHSHKFGDYITQLSSRFVNYRIFNYDANSWTRIGCSHSSHRASTSKKAAYLQCIHCGKTAVELGLRDSIAAWWCPDDANNKLGRSDIYGGSTYQGG